MSNRLCLAPAGGSRANNATIVQYTCKALGLTTFGTSYNDTYHAYEIESDQSLECLSPAGGSIGLNVAIVQYTCDGDPSRYWKIVPTSGVWTLQNLKSKLCLSPAGGSLGLNTVMVSTPATATRPATGKSSPRWRSRTPTAGTAPRSRAPALPPTWSSTTATASHLASGA